MDMQQNPKLDEIYKLVMDNNKMLHKMRREALYRSILGMIWWAILIIGPALAYYYYLQPYIDQMISLNSKLPTFGDMKLPPTSALKDLPAYLNSLTNMIPGGASTTVGH